MRNSKPARAPAVRRARGGRPARGVERAAGRPQAGAPHAASEEPRVPAIEGEAPGRRELPQQGEAAGHQHAPDLAEERLELLVAEVLDEVPGEHELRAGRRERKDGRGALHEAQSRPGPPRAALVLPGEAHGGPGGVDADRRREEADAVVEHPQQRSAAAADLDDAPVLVELELLGQPEERGVRKERARSAHPPAHRRRGGPPAAEPALVLRDAVTLGQRGTDGRVAHPSRIGSARRRVDGGPGSRRPAPGGVALTRRRRGRPGRPGALPGARPSAGRS